MEKCLVTDEFEGNVRFKIWMDLSLQNFTRVDGQDKIYFLIKNASEADQGVYTCVCTWMYNDRKYQSSGSRMVRVGEAPFSGSQSWNVLLGGEMTIMKNLSKGKGTKQSRNGGSTHAFEVLKYFKGRQDG